MYKAILQEKNTTRFTPSNRSTSTSSLMESLVITHATHPTLFGMQEIKTYRNNRCADVFEQLKKGIHLVLSNCIRQINSEQCALLHAPLHSQCHFHLVFHIVDHTRTSCIFLLPHTRFILKECHLYLCNLAGTHQLKLLSAQNI